jgi:hypothetical protein
MAPAPGLNQEGRDGTGPKSPDPNIMVKVRSRMGIGWNPEIHCATPPAMPSMARVTRNDGILALAARPPLISPMARPTPAPARTPSTRLPVDERVRAVTTLDSPATDPTDRSI